MCFLTKCPYVPPHEFDLDFPHLMLRYRAVEAKKKGVSFADRELARTDRNGAIASKLAPLADWATDREHGYARAALETIVGLHREAVLPKYSRKTLEAAAKENPVEANRAAPGFGRKAVIYATCFGEYNDPAVGLAARAVLAKNGVETEIAHPRCCGMPLLEQGLLGEVAAAAKTVAAAFERWIDEGYDVIALVPSCALMLKFEWPLIVTDDPRVKKLAQATYDLSEYVVGVARAEGLAEGLAPVEGAVAFHVSCHSRAQNFGRKGKELLRLLPQAEVTVIERCSGHGGAWGYKTANFETALKVGKPVARQAAASGARYLVSECPLSGPHIAQGVERLGGEGPKPELLAHPIQLLARAYGLR
jgi:glycerol-3-phosphate dehydrogenase subunit C